MGGNPEVRCFVVLKNVYIVRTEKDFLAREAKLE